MNLKLANVKKMRELAVKILGAEKIAPKTDLEVYNAIKEAGYTPMFCCDDLDKDSHAYFIKTDYLNSDKVFRTF